MPRFYTFIESSPDWPAEFEREAERLRSLLGGEVVTVHHIGSTSVDGLAAKPIIDILPVVRALRALDTLVPTLEEVGYHSWGEHGLPGRRFFTKDKGDVRTHNVHFYEQGHPDIERHTAFRDYLRSNEPARSEYEAIKREGYRLHPNDFDAYHDHKGPWIKRTEAVAIAWRRGAAK